MHLRDLSLTEWDLLEVRVCQVKPWEPAWLESNEKKDNLGKRVI